MERRAIYLNAKETYKTMLYSAEKAFREKSLHKIAESNKNNPKQFRGAVKSLLNNAITK